MSLDVRSTIYADLYNKEHLFDIESEDVSSTPPAATYIVYPDEFSGDWRVQAVPVSPESFESRKALPEKWRGLRDDVFSETSGIQGGIFVHASGFIGGIHLCSELTGDGIIEPFFRKQNQGRCSPDGQSCFGDVVD